jgi:3',5'-cyclic AMP phosphodiesterase CpdA
VRTLAHISDLHFGCTDPVVVPVLRESLIDLDPDLVIVSGDLTQRARRRQFAEAREFMRSIPLPQLAVPGNHDVPLYNVIARSLRPLRRYREYIGDDLAPFFSDREIAVQGINTARSATFKNGRINAAQVHLACSRFDKAGHDVVRIIVTHHPFDEEAATPQRSLGRAAMALAGFAECGVDLILSGHWHRSHSCVSTLRIEGKRSALLIQAGTATSSRTRDEPNSYNVIRIEYPTIAVQVVAWNAERQAFVATHQSEFRRDGTEWVAAA